MIHQSIGTQKQLIIEGESYQARRLLMIHHYMKDLTIYQQLEDMNRYSKSLNPCTKTSTFINQI